MRASYHGKCFAFTVNYGDDQEGDVVKQIKDLIAREEIEFLVAGLETAPTTGQKHVQGFMQLKKDTRKSTSLSYLPDGAHIEKALRGRYANFKYCTKEGNVIAMKGFEKRN